LILFVAVSTQKVMERRFSNIQTMKFVVQSKWTHYVIYPQLVIALY
jgi:hypothetical protein